MEPMAYPQLASVLRYVRSLIGTAHAEGLSDGELLRRFADQRDEAAFTTLLQRHRPMVLSVCRQVLGELHAAEDAFQATFIILARKAHSIRKQESAAGWLHRVACNVARKARTSAARRCAYEEQAASMANREPTAPVSDPDWGPLLHEEIDRLPGKYRSALVLCYLQGKTNEEAARELGWPSGTVKGRLARARQMLRDRLVRRLAITVLAASELPALEAQAAVPAALAARTHQAALAATVSGSPAVTILVDGVLRDMYLTKIKIAAVMFLVLGMTGAGLLVHHALAQRPDQVAASQQLATPVETARTEPAATRRHHAHGHGPFPARKSGRRRCLCAGRADRGLRRGPAASRSSLHAPSSRRADSPPRHDGQSASLPPSPSQRSLARSVSCHRGCNRSAPIRPVPALRSRCW